MSAMYHHQQSDQSHDQVYRTGPSQNMSTQSVSLGPRTRADMDSWVEISSQPSTSSMSSVADEIVTTGLRVQSDPRARRRRPGMHGQPSSLGQLSRNSSQGETSSQEEYEESESESDRLMTSSNEDPGLLARRRAAPLLTLTSDGDAQQTSEDDDENKTAINYPINAPPNFTPRPNAFSHPPNARMRRASQPVPGSYFPPSRPPVRTTRASFPAQGEMQRPGHMPQNILSPSYNAAAQHEEALRASLSGLLSVAAAARGLQKTDPKRQTATVPAQRSSRLEPTSFRLVPESALQATSPPQFQEPTFKPTIRRASTARSASTAPEHQQDIKRKDLVGRSSSRERRALKKARRSTSTEELFITPTLLTWVVSAGVVVVLSALSFSAGYSMGKEAGRLETGGLATDEHLRSCAREAGRSSLGLKRSLARSAIQV